MKQYVAVESLTDEAGQVRPTCVRWEDGRRFEIQAVLDVRRAASLKAGGTGLRYLCQIGGRTTFLYYEDPKWFVDALGADEKKTAAASRDAERSL